MRLIVLALALMSAPLLAADAPLYAIPLAELTKTVEAAPAAK